MKQKHLWLSFTFFIILCFTVEIAAGYWTNQSVSTWYPKLSKPSWTPPGWLFGPVWFILYIMIAVSGWLIYNAEYSRHRSITLILYASQLLLNLFWSFLFFSLRSPLLGLIDILLLNLLIILTIIYAWKVRRLASLLLIPYLIWVMYATSLNASIWQLNESL